MITLYNQITCLPMNVIKDNYVKIFTDNYRVRPSYEEGVNSVTYSQVFAVIKGVHFHEEDYLNELFEMIHEKKQATLIGKDFLNKQINNEHFQSIQKIMNIHQEQKLSVNRFVAFLDGEKLLPKSNQPEIHRNIRKAFIEVLKKFEQTSPSGLNNPDLRRVLVDLVKWSANHLNVLENISSINDLPKFIWFGDTSVSHSYFLMFLYQLGLDVLIYTPLKNVQLNLISDLKVVEYEQQKDLQVPDKKVQRATTVAYRAAREIDTMLQSDENVFFRPWALRDHAISALTMKTTYDELFIMAKAQSFIRPNFKVVNSIVTIPVVFAKIMGVSRNRKEYWDRFHEMINQENSYLLKNFPLLNETSADFRFHYQNALNHSKKIDLEKLMRGNYWSNFNRLPSSIQQTIANGLKATVDSSHLFTKFTNETDEDLKIYLFKQITRLPMDFVRMIQKYDFSKEVPKLVIYNNEKNGIVSRADTAIIFFLNKIGFDILVYNPTGHNDIEQYIESSIYDIHWLDEMVFDLEIRENSIKKRFTGILKNLKGE